MTGFVGGLRWHVRQHRLRTEEIDVHRATFIEAADEATGYGVEHAGGKPTLNWERLVAKRTRILSASMASTRAISTASAWSA